MSAKVCSGCRYFKLNMQQFPCCDCHDGSRWEPADDGKPDNINHPAHYEGSTSIECIDAIELAFGQEGTAFFCLCNAFKYLWRHKHKGGREDLDKAGWYLDRAGRYPVYTAQEEQTDILKRMLKEARKGYEGENDD